VTLRDAATIAADIASTLALVIAAAYFLYRAAHGYLFPNASIELSSQRRRADGSNDYLAVSVKLVRGNLGGSLFLLDASVWVAYDDVEESLDVSLPVRLSYRTDADARVRLVNDQSRSVPYIRLPQGDAVAIGAYGRVPAASVCTIRAAVLTSRREVARRTAQWQATAVSLPETSA
jgi:hypothetical protein